MGKEIFDKLGIDISAASKVSRGFFRGLITEYSKNIGKFNSKEVQTYFHHAIAVFMLEYQKIYGSFDIKIPYRIKSPKSVLDKILEYLGREDKCIYEYNKEKEFQGKLREDLTDMFAITVVGCNRPPTFYSNDPEINELIEEKKRNHILLGQMQRFKSRITNSEFPGNNPLQYDFSCTKEEYYINSMILINRIKSLIDPNATKLLKKYDLIFEKIKEKIPEEFYFVAEGILTNENIMTDLNTQEKLKNAYEKIFAYINNSEIDEDDMNQMRQSIDFEDIETVDFIRLLDDFTASLHDKLDLAVLTKQVYSIFDNSEYLQRFGIKLNKDNEKKKRTASGYVSNFAYLDTPFGRIEMQLQTQHQNIEGNYGETAHYNMEGKDIGRFEIPEKGDKENIKKFRIFVEMVSPKKFLAQFDTSEPGRVLTQIFGKYENYKSIMSQVKKGSKQDIENKKYFAMLYPRRKELFAGELKQERVEYFSDIDIEDYLASNEFKKIIGLKQKSRE